jgi:subtilisin family serine protease
MNRAVSALFAAMLLLSPVIVLAQEAKKPVNSEADLPRYTYPVTQSASALMQADAATFDPFAAKVLADIDATLNGYDIKDAATMRGLLGEKLEILTLQGKNEEALDLVRQVRNLQTKPDAKLTSGLRIEAILQARIETGQTSGDAFSASFQKHYTEAVNALPYDVAGTSLKEAKEGAELASPALVLGQVQSGIDPAVEKTHEMGGDFASAVIGGRLFDRVSYPVNAPALAVLDGYLEKYAAAKKTDIWPSREVSLDGVSGLKPVTIAIWDSGSDLSLFPNQTYTDPHADPEDAHGIAFDLRGFPTHGMLFPITPDRAKQYPGMVDDLQGLSDLQASIDSPAATSIRKQIAAMNPTEAAAFLESLEYFSQYAHGTHVTGIAVKGNPAARILIGRLTYDYKTIPTPPNDADVKRGDDDYQKYVDYFKAHDVRVVNMSWGGTAAGYESALEKNGMGKDAATRKALAARWFAMDKKALYDAIKSAPGILFVAAAGNSDSDATFDDSIPSSLKLPNLLTVGAVDQAGDAASFTSYGPTVRVYADGYQVVSTLPGGYKVAFDGTSMASPNAANLAAKLIAIDPALTPTQTIGFILKGAGPSSDGKRLLIDPKASIDLLKSQMPANATAR